MKPVKWYLIIGLYGIFCATLTLSQETERYYLSGTGSDDTVLWDFYCTEGRRSKEWAKIAVPSNWECEGFGAYNYGGERNKSDEQGHYRTTFSSPPQWRSKTVYLVFEGVMTDTEVQVNGRSAGPVHQGGFYRFKYDITPLIQTGANQLDVWVSKVSANRSVEQAERQADYWVFGGIYRPVYLEMLPKQHIARFAVDARTDGTLQTEIFLQGKSTADTITAEVSGPDLTQPVTFTQALDSSVDKVILMGTIPNVKPWSSETPCLYRLKISLQQNNILLHTVSERIGFRTFEVRPGDGLYLNGRKIRLKGVNRHCFWPDTGRSLNRRLSYQDARLIKDMNMNAVRMSHYPPDTHFLEACDELGLYVLDELAGWQAPPYDTDVGEKLVKEMVTRDQCHPCILFWDNANEGGWNPDLDDDFARFDPQQRTVLHPWANFNHIDTDHYEDYASVLRKLQTQTLFMPTEFLHGLYDGGHGAGLNDYWEQLSGSPLGAGGFLWVFADEGVVRTDQNGRIDVAGNQAPDGILGPYREKEASFYTIKEIWSPIQIPVDTVSEDFTGRLPVQNRYHFTNLNQCWFTVQLVEFPRPWHHSDQKTIVFSQGLTGPDVPPGGAGVLTLSLPLDWHRADALLVSAFDPAGREVWTWSWPIQMRRTVEQLINARNTIGTLSVSQEDKTLIVRHANRTIRFDTLTGRLAKIECGQQAISLTNGPRMIHGSGELESFEYSQTPSHVTIDATYAGNLKHVQWQVLDNGWIRLSYEYALDGEYDLMGVDFDYPEQQVRAMRRLGRGPYRVWKNRLRGGTLDVWRNTYKDHRPGVTWDFPEFRGYYHDWVWVRFDTTEGRITLVNATEDLYLGVYRPKDGPEPRETALDIPDTGLSLLHGIPPMGTKFKRAEVLGPQSRKNQAEGQYTGTVYLHVE